MLHCNENNTSTVKSAQGFVVIKKYGFNNNVLLLVSSYLSDRYLSVDYKNQSSKFLPM